MAFNPPRNLPINREENFWQPSPYVSIHLILELKMFTQQLLLLLFGEEICSQINQRPIPFIFPWFELERDFDVYIYILY